MDFPSIATGPCTAQLVIVGVRCEAGLITATATDYSGCNKAFKTLKNNYPVLLSMRVD